MPPTKETKRTFDPKEYMTQIKGKDYLPVAARLIWFREEHPNWGIETAISHDFEKKMAIANAKITDDKGKTIATAHKMENIQGFGDYLEKAETGAVGRALAMCGYGTQFSPEIDEGTSRIVDSPVTPKSAAQPTPEPQKVYEKPKTDFVLVGKQKMYFMVAREAGYEGETAKEMAKTAYKVESFNDLTQKQLEDLIAWMTKKAKPKEEVKIDEKEMGKIIEDIDLDDALGLNPNGFDKL